MAHEMNPAEMDLGHSVRNAAYWEVVEGRWGPEDLLEHEHIAYEMLNLLYGTSDEDRQYVEEALRRDEYHPLKSVWTFDEDGNLYLKTELGPLQHPESLGEEAMQKLRKAIT